jgi:hypothetical protein
MKTIQGAPGQSCNNAQGVKERTPSAVVRLLTTNFAVADYSAAVKAPAFLPALTSL